MRQPQLVISGKLAEITPDPHAMVRHTTQIAACIFDRDNLLGILLDQRNDCLILNIGHRAARHIIKHDGKPAVFCELADMRHHASLAASVVIRGTAQPRRRRRRRAEHGI